ncbi:hypothetical protein GEV33_007198 [Tenebrio molitor]|uniref:Uncharacterized protein n=1 Tax=Tenebrio molitor TaxID=7067 RepID=A0A8J6HJR0_TENMO|nr:hypothetical protein GEV33_007198 [Tenebrio molitor]
MSGPRGHLGPGNRNRPPNPSPDCTRFVRPPTDHRAPLRYAVTAPKPPGPYQVCATQPREHIRRTATLSHNEPPRPTAQLTTTLVYPQVPPSPNSVHTMDHLLDLEWTVVDEVDVALAGVDSPDPSPAAQPSVRRPRPGPCGALLLALWNDGADVPRLSLFATPGRPPPASSRPPMPGHPELPGTSSDSGASAVPAVRPPPATTPPSPSLTPARRQPKTFRYPRHIYRRTVSLTVSDRTAAARNPPGKSPPEKEARRPTPPHREKEPLEGATLRDPPFPKKEGCPSSSTDSDSASDLTDNPLSPFFLARSLPLRGNPGFPAVSLFFLARSLPLRGNPGFPAFSSLPGPFPPIAREPRLSRFLLLLPGPFPPIAREPRPSRFLLFSRPVPSRCEGTPAIPLPFTLLSPTGTERASGVQVRPEREEPAASRSDRKGSKYEPRPPPTPARNTPPGHGHRPRKVPAPPGTNTPFFVHSVNKAPLVATPVCFATPFPRPDSRPPDTVRSAKLPRPCGVPPQPQKGTGARAIPRPIRTASNPVTSLPQVIVTTFRTGISSLNFLRVSFAKYCATCAARSTAAILSASTKYHQFLTEEFLYPGYTESEGTTSFQSSSGRSSFQVTESTASTRPAE